MSYTNDVFPLGKIVPSIDVVDRHSFIKESKMRLMHGNSIMISGPRRIGKSSVAHEIMRQLQNDGCYVVKLDLMYTSTIEEFATKLIQSILENRTGVLPHVSSAIQQLRNFFQNSELHAKINDLELGITLDAQSSPTELLETAFHMAETMAKKDDKRMVILLDEFQELDRLDQMGKSSGQSLLKRLRSIFQQQEHTTYFFLGSESSLLNTIFAERNQAFYRFTTLLQLPSIPEGEWKTYIQYKLRAENIQMTDSAIRMLMERTGGHPYCVMSIMANAYFAAKISDMNEINAKVLDRSYNQSLSQLDAVYEEQWQEIRRFKGADLVLRSILLNKPIHNKEAGTSNVTRSVKNLMRLSVIEKGDSRGEYRLLEPMFGDWILKNIQER
ncbi:AAA family ATPase [Alicyclobacillus fastidiosus]|uniref:ATP-binding protein n=1 Tax=Alicyclobacillus fastidiosus TaxID=392011 RepID=A0ABV5AIC2_9BACL|nr:ATP-binding protein [Alicyclobacillus fastidiosus]WEH10088.1 ATP-binding protein [Alicyclobacillus fastidiosus]